MGCIGTPIGGLVTYGLGVDPFNGSFPGLITAWQFQLLCVNLRVQLQQVGGSRPLAPGEIQQFYKLVDDPSCLAPKLPVCVRIEYYREGEKLFHTSNYIVSPRQAARIVRIVNLINKTNERIMVYARNLMRVMADNVVTRGFKRITGQATVEPTKPSVTVSKLEKRDK